MKFFTFLMLSLSVKSFNLCIFNHINSSIFNRHNFHQCFNMCIKSHQGFYGKSNLKLCFLALFVVWQKINWVNAWEETCGVFLNYVHFDKVSAIWSAHILAEQLDENSNFLILFWFIRFTYLSALSCFLVVDFQEWENLGCFWFFGNIGNWSNCTQSAPGFNVSTNSVVWVQQGSQLFDWEIISCSVEKFSENKGVTKRSVCLNLGLYLLFFKLCIFNLLVKRLMLSHFASFR